MTGEPLDPLAEEVLSESLPDHPLTFGIRGVLKRHVGRSWAVGPLSQPRAAVVVVPWAPTEPDVFGTDPEGILRLLGRVAEGWDCVHAPLELGEALQGGLERDFGLESRLYGDVYHVLDQPPRPHEHPAVRRLTESDLELLEAAPPPLRPVGYDSLLAALTGGVSAGAFASGALVGTVSMSISSAEFADLGAYFLEPWRRRGLGTAAASLVAGAVQDRGLVPVWSTGEDNAGSRRVAAKVGFREFGRKVYVVVPELRENGGFRSKGSEGYRASSMEAIRRDDPPGLPAKR